MIHLTIKAKVTLWYTLLMIVVVTFVIVFMMIVSGKIVENSLKRQLITAVENNMDDVDHDNGNIEVEKDFVFSSAGVYLSVFDGEGNFVTGYQFEENISKLQDDKFRIVKRGNDKLYTYDRLIELKKNNVAYIRGSVSVSSGSSIILDILKISFITLPILVILASVGGYFIAYRAFRPIHSITKTVDDINEGKDLSKRVNLPNGKDEIYKLANTFDMMFARLEKSFNEEQRFTTDASHELRTPVSVILANTDWALEHASTLEEHIETHKIVKDQTIRMSRIISSLLNFTRVEQGNVNVDFELANLSELVEVICDEYRSMLVKNITLNAIVEPGIYARIDISLITRLLYNLIDNANKYGKENGYICVKLLKSDSDIHLIVEDNGIGISKEEQEMIWNRFYRSDVARELNQGTGLGLSIVKQIAEIHSAEIKVLSEVDKGSTFIFLLKS